MGLSRNAFLQQPAIAVSSISLPREGFLEGNSRGYVVLLYAAYVVPSIVTFASKGYNITVVAPPVPLHMNENVITIEECRKRTQKGSFDAILKLEASSLRLMMDDEPREVLPERVECKWNKQPAPSKSKSMAYILVGLPLAITIIYMVLAYGLHLW